MRNWFFKHVARSLACPHEGLWYRLTNRLRVSNSKRLSASAVSLCCLEPGDRVLEVGFGAGYGLLAASQTGAEVFGVEVSAAALSLAYTRLQTLVNKQNVLLLQTSVESMPFPTNWFNTAFHVDSFPFWKNQDLASRELFRILQPGGHLLCCLDMNSVKLDIQRGIYRLAKANPDPVFYMHGLEMAGFTNIVFHYHAKETAHPYQTISAVKPA